MDQLVFDIETDGLLPELTKVHSLVIKRPSTGEVWSCTNECSDYTSIEEGLLLLEQADMIVGHNIIGFDLPALKKVYPNFKPRGKIRDTLVMTRLMWPKDQLTDQDFRRKARGGFPSKLIGTYSLEAWGYRIGDYKGDYKGPWDTWSKEMQDYCEQDVHVTCRLLDMINGRKWAEQSIELEHQVQEIIFRQEQYGFLFNETKATKLYAKLVARKQQLSLELKDLFPPWEVKTVFIPKVNNKKLGYVKGETFIKRKTVHFNPSSRQHIAHCLKEKYGWKPIELTNSGQPKIDDEVLSSLDYPEAKLLAEYFLIDKRLGQLATGKEAWLKHVHPDGRIRGRVITNGAVTGRMTHSRPNIAQVPGNHAPYGEECRDLFYVPTGKKLVGCDADALELRCLAGYMARYDGGAYVKTVLEGKKEEGTDMHTLNAQALGCSRDVAKTWFYAFIYGAGDAKLGATLGAPKGKEKEVGARSRARFLKSLPALGKITEKVKEKVKEKGFLKGLDGRRLAIRSDHAALNTLLQSAGAIIMKKALVVLDDDLRCSGYTPGVDYEFVANVHDEWQIEVNEDIADDIGQRAKEAIRVAGEQLNFGCPLAGAYDIGDSWKETH